MRLNKFIAQSGLASRRKADGLISDGQVRVNGQVVKELGFQVDPRKDEVVVKGKRLHAQAQPVYFLFNKPTKVLTSLADPEGRPTVKDFLDRRMPRLFPVGRLDWDTEGMLILTNDGDLAQKISHPKHGVAKTYIAKLDGQPTDEDLAKLRRGVSIIGGKANALHCSRLKNRGSRQYDWIKIIIDEGRNRQVRNMFAKIGFDVKKLQRVAVGSLRLGNLDRGKLRQLTAEDVRRVFQPPKELREDHGGPRGGKKSSGFAKRPRGAGGKARGKSRRPSSGKRR